MSIPLIFLLYLYFIGVAFFVVYALFNVYHLLRFGFFTVGTMLSLFIFIAGSFLIIIFSWAQLSAIDWSASLELFPLTIY